MKSTILTWPVIEILRCEMTIISAKKHSENKCKFWSLRATTSFAHKDHVPWT